jgi:hypothetical protein
MSTDCHRRIQSRGKTNQRNKGEGNQWGSSRCISFRRFLIVWQVFVGVYHTTREERENIVPVISLSIVLHSLFFVPPQFFYYSSSIAVRIQLTTDTFHHFRLCCFFFLHFFFFYFLPIISKYLHIIRNPRCKSWSIKAKRVFVRELRIYHVVCLQTRFLRSLKTDSWNGQCHRSTSIHL